MMDAEKVRNSRKNLTKDDIIYNTGGSSQIEINTKSTRINAGGKITIEGRVD